MICAIYENRKWLHVVKCNWHLLHTGLLIDIRSYIQYIYNIYGNINVLYIHKNSKLLNGISAHILSHFLNIKYLNKCILYFHILINKSNFEKKTQFYHLNIFG